MAYAVASLPLNSSAVVATRLAAPATCGACAHSSVVTEDPEGPLELFCESEDTKSIGSLCVGFVTPTSPACPFFCAKIA